MQVALQHALVEQHVAHWLRDDDVHLLGQRHLFHLPWNDDHALPQTVAVHQYLQRARRPQLPGLKASVGE